MDEKEYFCIRLSGVVQGVGMRYYINSIAQKINLSGYVRNLSDGRVECVIYDTPQKLEQFIELLNNSPRGRIDGITVTDYTGTEKFQDFTIRY
ncbi:MAG: acylphosphatase [Firmicutes bacterium]|nr:acylphosphatase [Bacillota bacterium]